MRRRHCKVLVLGGGPGGYAAAIRAGQLGLDTVLVESERLGGTCLNVGCIPSKALIHAADEFHKAVGFAADSKIGVAVAEPRLDFAKTLAWKDGIVSRLNTGVAGLLRKAKVSVLQGWGVMSDGKTCEVRGADGVQFVDAEAVVLATGSRSLELSFLPFGERVISSTEALALDAVPGRLVVVGGGYIGLELGMAYRKFGSEVTVVEARERILPQYDAELTAPVQASLKKQGIDVLLGTEALRLDSADEALRVRGPEGEERSLAADRVLVTVGRRPKTEGWGLEGLDLTMNGPYVQIDERCRSSMNGVWAIGDLTGEPMLAHRAIAQGEMVAELIAGEKRSFDKRCIPAVCFTDPELVSAGFSPEQAEAVGYQVTVGRFPFRANGRAMTMESEDGFVRVVARADNHLLLGIQAVGGQVSELSAAFALALEMGARLEDVAATVHAHPTQSEALQEAAMMALGHALHL
jgi:dihydrolipoamide dehydrogenase